MQHAPMDYLDCACFTGRTSIPIRCIVERVNSNSNLTSPCSPLLANVSSTVTPVTTTASSPTATAIPVTATTTTSTLVTATTTVTTRPATNNCSSSTSSITATTTGTTATPTSTTTTISGSNSSSNINGSNALELDASSSSSSSSSSTSSSSSFSNTNITETSTDPPQAISFVTQPTSSSLPLITTSTNKSSSLSENLIPSSTISTSASSSTTTTLTQSSAGDKSSGERSESVVDVKTTNPRNNNTNCNNNISNSSAIANDDQNLDVNPAILTNSNNSYIDENIYNNSCSVHVTGNVIPNGDSSVDLSIGDKSINRSKDNISNQRKSTNSPLHDLSNKNNINSDSIIGNNNGVDQQQQLSPSSTLRSLFGLNTNPFQLSQLNLNQSHLNYLHNHNHHHHHHHQQHNLLSSSFDHQPSANSNQQQNGESSSPGNQHSSGSQRTFPASISPSGVVEQDSFAIITSGLLFSNLVKTALLHLGYSASEISGAKGFIQLRNWKPLTLDQITDSVDATVGDIMGDISSIASLRIILSRPRTSGPNEIEDKLLQVLLAQSYSLLANSGSPIDQTLLAALMGRNNRPGLEAELNEETRGKFDQWYMQQVFNQYRQMATLAAAQAHHQQAAAAAAAVMAATSQQQKHQAAAAALAAAVNAAAASAGASVSSSGGSVDGSSASDRSRGAVAAAAAAAAAVAAAANCQSLLNLDLDVASLASNASASGHSNHLKDNQIHQQHSHHHHSSKHHQHDHHHSRQGPNLASSSSPFQLSIGRSSDTSSGERLVVSGGGGVLVGVGGDRGKSEAANLSTSNNASSAINNTNNIRDASNNTNNSNNNNGNSNNTNSNRTSPNAPGQYVRTRIRTSFDPEMELPKLHKWFSENQHPSRAQIQQYVKELNSLESRRGRKPLDVNNVVYWFKNARAAHKRHELKLVNGSQSPTLSNNNSSNVNINNNNTNNRENLLPGHLRDPFEGRLGGLGSRSRLGAGLIPGLIGDRLGGVGGLNSGRGGNGETESYADSNGNEDLLGQMYDDDGSEGGDYDGDDMMMDDDCSSQISQTLDLSVRPVKRQRSDSSPPGSPISGPSSLSDLIRGTPPHTLASASSCHSNFNVKDEPPSDEDDDDDYDDLDERDYYPVAASRHGLNLQHGSISGRSSSDPHNLTSSANYLTSDTINGVIGDMTSSGRHHHHSSSSSSHDRHHHSSSSNLNNGGSSGSHGQPDSPEEGRRTRRSRTFIDPTSEVPKLEQWFSLCTHPNHPQIVQYTDELNSSPYRLKYPKLESKNIQFWFKNRRAKSKRQNLPISSSNTSPLAATSASSIGASTSTTTTTTSSTSTTSAMTSGPVTTASSSSSSSLSPSMASNCSVSSLSTSTGPASASVSSSALTIDRLIGH